MDVFIVAVASAAVVAVMVIGLLGALRKLGYLRYRPRGLKYVAPPKKRQTQAVRLPVDATADVTLIADEV